MQEVGMKMKNVRGRKDCLGQFFSNTKEAVIYVDEIIAQAREWGCDYQDLKKLVVFHEEAHFLHDQHDVTFPNSDIEELTADQYAARKFLKTQGRTPHVPMDKWFGMEVPA
jgi:hypothetical protein